METTSKRVNSTNMKQIHKFLTKAVKEGNWKDVQKLLPSVDNVNFENKNGNTLLIIAAWNEHWQIAETLLQYGANIEHKDNKGYIPLTLAVVNGNTKVINFLFKHNGNFNKSDGNGYTALTIARDENNNKYIKMLKLLLDCNADINYEDDRGYTALSSAIESGKTPVVEFLLTHNANIEQKDSSGNSPLLLAIKNGKLKIVDLLLKHDANIEHKNSNGDSPLLLAIKNGKLKIVDLLLKHDANIEHKNSNGDSPLLLAIKNGNLKIVDLLLKHDANIEHKNSNGDSPLLLAIKNGNLKIVELLLKHNANIEQKDSNGDSPLIIAVEQGNKKIIQLIRQYANINVRNDYEMFIIKNTKTNISELATISLRIRYYNDYINQHWDNETEKYRNKVRIYVRYLIELYENLPTFVKQEHEINENNCYWKTIKYSFSPVLLLLGISSRVAQRYFSVAVVADKNLIGKDFIEQLEILTFGILESLQISQNYAMAGIDTFLSYFLSYYPFGLKNIINLLFYQKTQNKVLNDYLPLEIIIKKLEKHLELKEYDKLNSINSKLDNLCTNLSMIIKKHDVINHLKDELKNNDFNDKFTFEKYKYLINWEFNSDFPKKILNELSKTDLKNEDYSLKKILENSFSNAKLFLITLLINHLVITGSSAYSAKTLTWDSYTKDILSINNFISTAVRATVMKFVNEYLIKDTLNIIFEPVKNYIYLQNNNHGLLYSFKNWVTKQSKLNQLGVFITSFIFTSFITNAIKTYAADITQNKGDWKKSWIQFQETFPKWGMLLSAFAVTTSDLYNLTNKMKPTFKLIYEKKEQQKIIEEVLSELPNIINEANENGTNSNQRIGDDTDNIHQWQENDLQNINVGDREHLIPINNRNDYHNVNKCIIT